MPNNNKNNNNPKDTDSALFRILTRLFSGPLESYRKEQLRTAKTRHMKKYAGSGKIVSAGGKSFARLNYDPMQSLQKSNQMGFQRLQRYAEFNLMEMSPDISSVLDVYGDELTTHSRLQNLLGIHCSNNVIKEELNNLFYNILNIEYNLYGWARSLCKYGDGFYYLDVDDKEQKGVRNIIPMPVGEMDRLEGEDPTNPNYVQFQWNNGKVTFENWQIAHFRILGNDKFYPFGSSVLDPARIIYQQLSFLENAMMSYRVVRCMHGDSNVWTKDGYKKIKDISVGDEVFSYDREKEKIFLTKVTDHINNGKQRIWKVKSLHRSLKTNFNHPIFVRNIKTKREEYVLVKDLVPKVHQLVLPRGKDFYRENIPINLDSDEREWAGKILEEGKNFIQGKDLHKSKRSLMREISLHFNYSYGRISQFLYGKNFTKGVPYEIAEKICEVFEIPRKFLVKYQWGLRKTNVNLPNFVDKEFARFFGFMTGDGFIRKDLTSCGFAAGIREDINQYYAKILKKYYPDLIFIHDKRNKHKQVGWYRVNSEYFANILINMGLTCSVYTKRIPKWVFESSREIQEAFLDGLIDADGHRRAQANVESMEIKLCNKLLIEDVKELCNQIGWNVSSEIYHGVENAREFNGYTIPKTYYYSLYFTKVVSNKYENIISVEQTEEYEDVYDIRVDNDMHNFVSDGCVVHNSAERRVFYLDIGGIDPKDEEQLVSKAIEKLRGENVVDSSTGRADLRYSSNSAEHDYFIPVRGSQSGTRIETLPGGQYTGDIDDVKYLRDKLFTALKVPMSYISRGEGNEDKEGLAQKDLRFARTIMRIQRSIVTELEKIAKVHLYTLGYQKKDLLSFKLSLNNPSRIAEMQELEEWRTKFDIASQATEGYFSRPWIAKKVFNLSDSEFEKLQRERFYDAAMDKLIGAEEGGELEGGGLGGTTGDEDLGGDLEDLEPTKEEQAEEVDSTLLAAPGRRDEPYLTPGSKGKLYFPAITDKRDMGARKRNYNSKFSKSMSRPTSKNMFGGSAKGLYEIDSHYEKQIEEVDSFSNELSTLFESLESAKKEENFSDKNKDKLKEIIENKKINNIDNIDTIRAKKDEENS